MNVLVTGATKGLGRAMVDELILRNANVYATGRDEGQLLELRKASGCKGRVFDLAKADEVIKLYADAKEAFGGAPDVLINNAGFNSRKCLLADATLEEFDLQYAVNLRAPFLLCREALKDMSLARRGHIVNIVSSSALFAGETMGIYTTMKTGFRALTSVLIKEARPFNVKVTGIYPGGIDTSFRTESRPDFMRPESSAKLIAEMIFAPEDTVVHELVFRPISETNY